MAAAQIQQALIAHDRVRRTTDIPLFYGKKGKDTITPQQLVERLERASRVAGWDALANPGQRKTDEFFLSLRENALSWYNTLDNIIGYNKEDWDELKKKFLEAYAPKYSAKALCICFQDLRQKSDECVQDFYKSLRYLPQCLPDQTRSHGHLRGNLAGHCHPGRVRRGFQTGSRAYAIAHAKHSLSRRPQRRNSK